MHESELHNQIQDVTKYNFQMCTHNYYSIGRQNDGKLHYYYYKLEVASINNSDTCDIIIPA